MPINLLDLGPALAAPLDAKPELLTEVAPPTHPLALLPVRLETRFFGRDDGEQRAARPGLPRPDPHRQPRPAPQRRGGRLGPSLLGAALAGGVRRRAAAQRVADAHRPLRARAGRVDRPPTRTDQPRRPADSPGRRRRRVGDAAAVSRPRRAGGGGPDAARRRAAGRAGSSPPTAAARCSPSSPDATSSPISPSVPIPTTPSPRRSTTRPRSASTRACGGWSTSTAPRRSAWPCASPLPGPLESAAVDVLVVVGVGAGDPERRGRAPRRPARRPPLHRRAGVRGSGHSDEQQRRATRRLRQP